MEKSTSTTAKGPDRLTNLPGELQNAIFAQLNYGSAINLSSTNRYYHHVINPMALTSELDKATFVHQAELHFPQHKQNKAYGCYSCYRVKPREAFSQKQGTSKDRYWTRFCLDCGGRKGIYIPGNKVRMANGATYWKCFYCVELKDGLFCTTCQLCQDCLHLGPFFEERAICSSCPVDPRLLGL